MRYSSFALWALFATASTLFADPVPSPFVPPNVFCFRFTDIVNIKGPGGAATDTFGFEFEVLNWSNTPAGGLNMAMAMAPPGVTLGTLLAPGVDGDGRPLTFPPTSDDLNFQPLDLTGTTPSPKVGLFNDWTPSAFSPTSFFWTAGTPLANRDLLAPPMTSASACALVPGCVIGPFGAPMIANAETIDNALGPDNVLDGFLLTATMGVGDVLVLNWFLLDPFGMPIGTPGVGNGYGFGIVVLARMASPATPGVSFFVGTSGTSSGLVNFFAHPSLATPFNPSGSVSVVGDPAFFGSEFGAGLTAPFLNPADNIFNAQPNARFIPEPGTLVMAAVATLGLICRRRRSTGAARKQYPA